jgi:hypothetical protein
MNKKYAYKLRPGHNSSELLIEFTKTGNVNDFMEELINLLKKNDFVYKDTSDIWMNDEIWINLNSDKGKITITKDIWDFVFILGEQNQRDIISIDKILIESGNYEKENVDFSEYNFDKK